MASGIFALFDDIGDLVKVRATTLDDVPKQVDKTTGEVSVVAKNFFESSSIDTR